MIEFIQECFCTVNLPATLLLCVVMLYWLMTIVGVFGMESFDLDVDADIDIDMDGDIDPGSGALKSVLELFYLGEVPVVIVATIFVITMWALTFLTNHFFNPEFGLVTAALWAIPNLIISLVATRFLTMPLARLFKNYDDDTTYEDRFIGRIGLVTTTEVTDKFGQIELKSDGPPTRINARTRPGERLGQGDAARIVQCNRTNGTFLVELSKWENS